MRCIIRRERGLRLDPTRMETTVPSYACHVFGVASASGSPCICGGNACGRRMWVLDHQGGCSCRIFTRPSDDVRCNVAPHFHGLRWVPAQTVKNQHSAVKQDKIGPSKRNWRVSGKALANCCCAAQLNNSISLGDSTGRIRWSDIAGLTAQAWLQGCSRPPHPPF